MITANDVYYPTVRFRLKPKTNKQTSSLIEGVVDAGVSCRVRTPEQPTPSLVVQILKCFCTGCFVAWSRQGGQPGSECSMVFQGATSKVINTLGSSRKTPPLVPGAGAIPEFTAKGKKIPLQGQGVIRT